MTLSCTHSAAWPQGVVLLYTLGAVQTWELRHLSRGTIGKAVAYSPKRDRTFELQSLGIEPAFHGQGLEKQLLDTVLAALAEQCGSPIYLYTAPGDTEEKALYISAGGIFTEAGSSELLHRYAFYEDRYARMAAKNEAARAA